VALEWSDLGEEAAMTRTQRFAGWAWDQIPTHHQVEFWYRFPRTARWFERQANRRDERTK
jgi:hypothetical protein